MRGASAHSCSRWLCSARRDALEAGVDVRLVSERAGRRPLPYLVGELLCPVRMAGGVVEQTGDRVLGDAFVALLESCAHEARELCLVDQADFELLRAAPERLVAVAEDPVEHVALAAQVDVRYLGLSLEDGPQEVGIAPVELDDLLELVEDHHDAPLPFLADTTHELEQRLDRVVDVRAAPGGAEAEAQRAVLRVHLHRRNDAEAAEELRSTFVGAARGGVEVAVDRACERGGQPLLARHLEQVDVADERAFALGPPRRPQYERRLAVAARCVDEHVLAVP